VTELFERDRAADRARRQLREEVGLVEPRRRQRGEHGRREERARKRQAAHLLHDDGHVDETKTEPAVSLPHQEPGPSERGQLPPNIVGEAALVLGHGADVSTRGLARQERPHGVAQRVLLGRKREIQGTRPSPRNLTRMLVFELWISRTPRRTWRSATSCGRGSTRTCR